MTEEQRKQAYDHAWYIKNKDDVNARSKKYKQQDGYHERMKAKRKAMRASQKGLWDLDVWTSTLSSVRQRAKQKKLPYNLTAKYMASITPTHCPVLNIPLQRSTTNGATQNSPSIDRLVPERGYVQGNVIVVSMLANTVRSTATPEQIQAVALFYKQLLTEHQ